ncbi:SigE family RNA polymerase sigma factor [Longispora fulva]|uniref:RNA polymerase sigma-70 factor (Sigma-E family) n=1 Tax=Longispora fulva TaxID=619741 RepID=A0A8J7GE48_9ACTN|nr:SigE family RNA polymerase sigma factor [Longispora fulva]MBG6134842.1 RNA polymerase sigma-70 factor (sigma-E family) [Longispora fulva]
MRDRDDTEFREFVSSRIPGLRRSAYLLCGDVHTADDLVSIAVGKVYRHWRRIQRLEHPDAYLRRMLLTAWLDERRRPWRREQPTDAPPERAHPGERDVTERLSLLGHLDRLTGRQRAVLVLRFFDDLSVEQTADLLRLSTGTVKTHTARGLAALRDLIGVPALTKDQT